MVTGFGTPDFTYTATTIYIFTTVEPSLACSLACMPLLRPVVEALAELDLPSSLPWLRLSTSHTRSQRSVENARDTFPLATRADDVAHQETHVSGNRWPGDKRNDQGAIYINRQFEQRLDKADS